MNFKRLALLSSAVLFLASSGFAAYTIRRVDQKPLDFVQGRDYAMEVFSAGPVLFDNVFLQATGALADVDIFVGPGIQVGPNEYKVDATGHLNFILRSYRAPGSYSLTATNANDATVFTTVNPNVQRYPVTFQITPSLPTIDANVSFNVQVTAIDSFGTFVSAFEDAVQIKDLQLGGITSISGSTFVNGAAPATVTVKAGDMNNKVALRLDLVGIQYYDSGHNLVAPATYTTPQLNLNPGAYTKLVMLFPGEVLDPGIGKNGTVVTQVANVPVSNVTIWPVDAFFNPIHTTVNMDVHFNSSVGLDVMPADRTMTTPPLQVAGGAIDPFIFPNNGTRFITATHVGAPNSEQDVSQVPVAPGATNLYDFAAQQPVGPYLTDDVISVKITARDSIGNVLTTLFGPLPGAKLSARIIGAPTQENVQWADTNPATLVPDNVVNFVAGVATVNLAVTKRGNQVDLHFQDQFGVGVYSNQFQVNVGALDKIHLTIVGRPGVLVGETFTPGTYPGNSGTPPAITAGDPLVVEARLVDRHWNIVSGPAIIGTPIQLDGLVPTSYITSTHPLDPAVTFDISGELKYQGGSFDNSFRVMMRTAGLTQQFRANTNFSPLNFLSSTVTVSAGGYNRIAFAAPGETLRPGSFFASGKQGVPSTQGAGISFPMNVFLTDVYWNPVASGPFSSVRFSIIPGNPGSFISGVTLGQPVTMPASTRQFTVTLAANTDIRVEDAAASGTFQNVSIPVGPGTIDHFTFTLASLADKEAGVPFGVTIEAMDKFNQVVTGFNNSVTLSANTGALTMTPTSLTFSTGVFNGNLTCFTANNAVQITMTRGSVTSVSSSFRVLPSAQGYKKLLLLGPDEVARPGTPNGKSGSNAARPVGTAVTIKAVACDPYFNALTSVNNQQVQFQTNSFGQFNPATGDLSAGEYSTTFIMKGAVLHTLTALDLTAGGVASSTSTIAGKAGTYSRLQILMPGEVSDPGNDANGGKNPAFPPTNQMVSVTTGVVVLAVDNYFNLALDNLGNPYSAGDVLFVSSPTNSLYLPPNNIQGGPTPRPFVNDIHNRSVLFGQQGFYVLKAFDQNDFTKTFGAATINVQPGPIYTFQNQATAVAGSAFPTVTIQLELAGVPVAGYNQSVYLSAVLPDGTPATGQFTPDGSEKQYVMNNGAIVINNLNYQYVETIKIKVRDIFGRVAFSNPIDVIPSGLKYALFADSQTVAGPPASFAFRVELRDTNTNTLVSNSVYNHTLGVTPVSLLNATANGTLSVSSASLTNGVATLNLSYTKAELIDIRVTNIDLAGWTIAPQNSSAITVKAGTYRKLLILAPGETYTPGVLTSATGKTGAPTPQDRKLGVVFQIAGTDQYWNTVDTFNGGKINIGSTDPDAFLDVPVPQDGALASGATASLVKFNKAGNIPVTVTDLADGTIISQQIVVPVVGTFFDIQVPATQNTGATFSMIITLRNNQGQVVPSFGPITIDAVLTDGSTAQGVLDVKTGNLQSGQATITNQRYTIAEDIRLRVSDGGDNVTNSNVIHFVPRAIFYVFQNLAAEGEVNQSFTFRIQSMDADTGTQVKNFNRANLPLDAFSAATGNQALGVFVPNHINIVGGAADVTATYNRAEGIYLRLTDNTTLIDPPPTPTQASYFSGSSIKIKAGALSTVDLSVAEPVEFIAGQISNLVLTLKDSYGNLIPDQTIAIAADEPDQLKMNNSPNGLNAKSDSNGQVALSLEALPFGNGDVHVVIKDVDRPNRGFARTFIVRILGMGRGPKKALSLGGNRVPVHTQYLLDVTNVQINNGGVLNTFYRVDGGAWQTYNPATGTMPLDTSKDYSIEWYSSVCYPAIDPTCANAVSELSISGAPNFLSLTVYQIGEKLNAYPNPFNPKDTNGENYVTIQYPLAAAASVEVSIYTLDGKLVWHVNIDEGAQGGEARSDNRVLWTGVNDSGRTVASGVYIATVKAPGQIMRSKIAVVN